MLRVTVDTQVAVRAFLRPHSGSDRIPDELRAGRFEMASSDTLRHEPLWERNHPEVPDEPESQE